MFNEKIIKLKNLINKYIYDKNEDIYIKLQTLYEFLIKDYVYQLNVKNNNFKNIDSANTIDLIEYYIKDSYSYKKEVIEVIRQINKKSNAGLKHYNELIVEYDEEFVKKSIKTFNKFNLYLFKGTSNRYHINEEIFNIQEISIMQNTSPTKIDTKVKDNETKEIIINTGTSNFDYGFKVVGIKNDICEYPHKSIYAIIFNLLQRTTVISKDKYILYYESLNGYEVDYSITYRYEMAILLLIKNNYQQDNVLKVYSVEKNDLELDCAIQHINYLFNIISKLLKKKIEKINIINDLNGISISMSNNGKINVLNNLEQRNKERYLWSSQNLKYEINAVEDKKELEYLLQVIFQYTTFREGQLEAIESILNDSNNQIIIMPTGSGKSLIYYFIAFMQPSPVLIIEPTDILIKDQVRNLKELHNIDDCIAYFNVDNTQVNLNHKLIYLTPRVLQNRKFIISLIPHNVELNLSNVILDEIHTISNWSHDFRPDYLMMSFNLKTFLDNVRTIGFTATANYRVVKDISQQLEIAFNKIHTPINLMNDNICYEFVNYKNEQEYLDYFNIISKKIISNNEEKMIVFTKDKTINDNIKKEMDNSLKCEIDIFSEDDINSYDGFIKGRRSILISETNMGIGINIPSINRIMHYGIPVSKSKYVQEIGRAGRNLNKSYSHISFIDKNDLQNEDLKLIDLNTPIDDILDIIIDSKSDIALSFKQILGHLEHYSIMASKIRDIYNFVAKIERKLKSHEIIKIPYNSENQRRSNETCLYFLVKMGIIYNWYINKVDDTGIEYDIELSEQLEIGYIKKSCIDYIMLFGNSKETIYNIENSNKIEDIIYELQSWYYNQFLLYHREQLTNMIEFIEISKKNNYTDLQISKELFEYFSLTSTNIDEDVLAYLNKVKEPPKIECKQQSNIENTGTEVNDRSNKNITKPKCENNTDVEHKNEYIKIFIDIMNAPDDEFKVLKMEKYLETKYYLLADLFVFSYNLLHKKTISISRFERILKNINNEELDRFLDYYIFIYSKINNIEANLKLIDILKIKYEEDKIYDKLFNSNNKDLIYYYYLGTKINKLLEE